MTKDCKDIESRLENLGTMLRSEESMVSDVMTRVNALPQKRELKRKKKVTASYWPWWKRMAAFGAVAAAALFSVQFYQGGMTEAAEVLSKAAKAAAQLQSVFLQVQVRTLPRDNFEMIGTEYELVPHKLWKDHTAKGSGRWRIEKPGRVVVMDGNKSILWIKPNSAARGGRNSGFVVFLKELLDVHLVIDEAAMLANRKNVQSRVFEETNSEGKRQMVVIVNVPALGDFSKNAYLKNQSIIESDTQRIFRFDAETMFLEELEIYVKTKTGKTLVLAIEEVRCNEPLADDIFTLQLPANVNWSKKVYALPGTKYQSMGPREVARAIFEASQNEDWDEFGRFYPRTTVSDSLKDKMAGAKLRSLGEPFQSGLYTGWFVPYEIELRSGRVIKHNLAVRNDNKAKRFIFDGGL